MGERVIGTGVCSGILDAFLATRFEGGRHAARVEMISALER
jgi:ribose 5-phosphate isomerase B